MGFFDCVTVSLHILYTASKGLTKTLCGFRSKEHLASEHVLETQEKRLKVEKKNCNFLDRTVAFTHRSLD